MKLTRGLYALTTALLLSAAPALGLVDYYSLNNNKVLQTCAYISNAEDGIANWFRSQEPMLKIHFPKNEDSHPNANVNVYTLIMGGEDMNKATIGLNPYYKVCDEYALKQGYCEHESDEANAKKMKLAELIDSKSFSYPIESFMLNSKGDDHIYKLDKSGIYCVMFLTTDLAEPHLDDFIVEVDWIQSFGALLVTDFSRMFTSVYFAIAYIIVAMILSFFTYRKISRDGSSINIDVLKHKKYVIQYKTILFFWVYGILYLATVFQFYVLNKHGYGTESPMVPITNFACLSLSTIITVWLIYNLMLFSAGAWFNALKGSSTKLYVARVVSSILAVEMLLFDIESSSIYSLIGYGPTDILSTVIYVEYILIMLTCIIWAFLTSYSITDKRTKNVYLITMGMLSMLFSIIIFGAHFFSQTVQSTAVANVIEFVFSLILAMLWFNVVYDNNQLYMKL